MTRQRLHAIQNLFSSKVFPCAFVRVCACMFVKERTRLSTQHAHMVNMYALIPVSACNAYTPLLVQYDSSAHTVYVKPQKSCPFKIHLEEG